MSPVRGCVLRDEGSGGAIPARHAIPTASVRHQVKIAVDGAPVTQRSCEEVGADSYAANVNGPVTKAGELLLV